MPWNRLGLTHISFNVRNLPRWHDYLVSRGVECVSRPERSPRGHSFFFAKDVDGKTVSLADFKGKVVVLEWFNPECPFVRKHYGSGNMQRLQKEWTAKGVAWLTVEQAAARP